MLQIQGRFAPRPRLADQQQAAPGSQRSRLGHQESSRARQLRRLARRRSQGAIRPLRAYSSGASVRRTDAEGSAGTDDEGSSIVRIPFAKYAAWQHHVTARAT